MNHPGRWITALALAGLLAGCGQVEIRNPFSGWQTPPLESSLAATKTAIEGGGEWYTDACVLRLPGLAASRDACATYYDDVAPALQRAHDTAVKFAIAVRDGTSASGLAFKATQEARATLKEFADRYGVGNEPWLIALAVKLRVLESQLSPAIQGGK